MRPHDFSQMNTNTITCPHCKKDFQMDEVLRHKIEEDVKKQTEETHKNDLEKIKKETEQKISKEIEEKNKTELLDLQKQIDEQKKKNVEFKEKELKLEEEKRKLNELEENFEKRKKEESEKIREEAAKEASEKHRLEKLEWEKLKADQQKLIEELERKGKQGSQQLQGEVLELDLEEQLKNQFPQDEFLSVPKGVEGGDIWQKVKDRNGKVAGSILWETKRTKAWSPQWLPKLREDSRKTGATECILVSEVLPNDVKSFHRKDNVWISNYEYAVHSARTVRFLILSISATKSSFEHNDDELKAIREYITSDAFRHKFESHQESIKVLRDSLTAEKRASELRWKKQEIQIDRLDRNSSQMYGELQGIMGDELPDIQPVDLLEDGSQ